MTGVTLACGQACRPGHRQAPYARAAQRVDQPINASRLVDETLLDEVLREGKRASIEEV